MAYRIKPWEELTIRDDYMFKLVMKNKQICIRLIEMILGIRVKDIVYLEEEKTLQPGYASKGIRLDVYAADGENVYEVEMQVRRLGQEELSKRTRYYQSAIDMDILMAGQKYQELPCLYIVFICPFEVFGGRRHMYTFRNLCVEDRRTEMGDGTTKVFLSTKGKMDDVAPELKAFLEYVDGIVSEDSFVQEIEEEIRRVKCLEEERVSYMTYVMKLEEEREEGRKEGREEGRKEGRMEALLGSVRVLMKKNGWDVDRAMDALDVTSDDRSAIAAKI